MASDFCRVFPGFWEGSLRDCPPWTRLLFLAMISKADEHGIVHGTASFWAAYLNCSVQDVELALQILSSPDPESTTVDNEGRRIERWGDGQNTWRIVNYLTYYNKSREYDRKAYKAEWIRRKRRQLATGVDKNDNVDPEIENENENENENDIEQKKTSKRKVRSSLRPGSLQEVVAEFQARGQSQEEAERFWNYYESVGWKVGRNPMVKWRAAVAGWISRNRERARSEEPKYKSAVGLPPAS